MSQPKWLGSMSTSPWKQAQAQLRESDPGVCPRGNAKYLDLILSHPQIYARLHLAGTIPVLVGTSFDRWIEFFGVDYVLPDLWRPFMDGGPTAVSSVLVQQLMRLSGSRRLDGGADCLAIADVRPCPSRSSLPTGGLNSIPIRWNIIVIAISVLILRADAGSRRSRTISRSSTAAAGNPCGVRPGLERASMASNAETREYQVPLKLIAPRQETQKRCTWI